MKLASNMINSEGILAISEVRVTDLAKEYGTPLYVYDESLLKDTALSFLHAFQSNVFKTRIIYASKASSFIALLQLYQKLGLSIDVVSEGELYTALKAGVYPDNIIFHGNNKLDEELEMAIDSGVATIVLDNFDEAKRLSKILEEKNRVVSVLLRVNPGVEAHTHDYIKTATSDSKFGIGIKNGAALETLKAIHQLPFLQLKGIHSHIGSQIFSSQSFIEASKILLDFIEICKDNDLDISILNLGGGFGVYYTEEDTPFDIPEFLKKLSAILEEELSIRKLKLEEVWLEPGRSLVNESGTTLYEIGDIKKIDNEANYAFINGGMGDNLRVSLYGAKYEAVIANRLNEASQALWRVAGKYCESGDVLLRDIPLANPQKRDILAVLRTGAYTFSMFSNYNRLRRPAVVFVSNGVSRLVVKRESLDDLIALDMEE